MLECKICGKIIKSPKGFASHLKLHNKISLKSYYDEFIKKENEGVCKQCGKPTVFRSYLKGYRLFCSKQCYGGYKQYSYSPEKKAEISKQRMESREKTIMDKYGTKKYFQSEDFKKKYKKKMNEKYGVDYFSQADEGKSRRRKTCIEKYGVATPPRTTASLEKAKRTCLEKYGVEYYFKSEEFKNTFIMMNKNRTKEEQNIINSKMSNTKKKNNTYGTSKPEELFYTELKDLHELERQYKEERYPFACDFYFKDLDMFVELNLFWTHGKEPFDENNEEHKKVVKQWKSKNTAFYLNAVKNWTEKDLLKIDTAKENNLNYIMLYSLQEVEDFIMNMRGII